MWKYHTYSLLIATSLVLLPIQVPAQTAAPLAQPIPVRTMTVPAPDPLMQRQFFGRVTARDTVDLAFEVSGQIEMLDAPEGAILPAGTLLARLDPGPFERRVERAELALQQADRARTRALALADRNAASQVRAEDAQTAFDLAEVELRDARAALADAQITAPFDAQVADRIASPHAVVDPGQPILRLHDLSETRVQFDLPERLLRHLGDVETVRFDGHLPGETARLPLAFREFRAETGEIGQSYVISLAIVGERARHLRPGQSLIVRATIDAPMPGTALPASAIATTPDGERYVVVIDDSESGLLARHHPVSVTAPTGAGFVTTPLDPGTELVAVGAHAVPDGAPLSRYTGLTRGDG